MLLHNHTLSIIEEALWHRVEIHGSGAPFCHGEAQVTSKFESVGLAGTNFCLPVIGQGVNDLTITFEFNQTCIAGG